MKFYDSKQVNISCVWMQIIYMVGQYRHLPYIEFKWLNQEEIDKYDVNLIAENNLHGHTLEIDLEYPDTLHELHNDSPLAPEKHEISHMLFHRRYLAKSLLLFMK